MLHPGKIPPSKTNLGILRNSQKTTSNVIKRWVFSKVPTSSTPPPNYSIWAKALRVTLNIARQRSAPGSKSVFWEPERLENHDFHDFSDFHQNAQPDWSPTRNWEILQRNRNETGVGSNDRSFDASSGKNAPVQNEFRDFPKFSKNYLQGYKKLSLFQSAN